MSRRRQQAREIAAKAQANPERFYKDALRGHRKRNRKRNHDPWGSADACALAKAREAARMPKMRVACVTITEAGRAFLGRLTSARRRDPVNRCLPMMATGFEVAE